MPAGPSQLCGVRPNHSFKVAGVLMGMDLAVVSRISDEVPWTRGIVILIATGAGFTWALVSAAALYLLALALCSRVTAGDTP